MAKQLNKFDARTFLIFGEFRIRRVIVVVSEDVRARDLIISLRRLKFFPANIFLRPRNCFTRFLGMRLIKSLKSSTLSNT